MPLPTRPVLDPELDARLVERCLAGEAAAWSALVRRYERLVYAVARSYRLGDEDLGDVFQEVFAALHRGLPRLRDARALCRWLSSTTERVARTCALRQRRHDALTGRDPGAIDSVADPGLPPGEDLEQLESQQLIRLALAALAERCRKLLHALYYEDPTPGYTELSRRLGVPVGSLGPTRARCFDKLRAALAGLTAKAAGIREGPQATSPSDDRNPRDGHMAPVRAMGVAGIAGTARRGG